MSATIQPANSLTSLTLVLVYYPRHLVMDSTAKLKVPTRPLPYLHIADRPVTYLYALYT